MEQIKIQEASRQREATQRAPNADPVKFSGILVLLTFPRSRELLVKSSNLQIWLVGRLKLLLLMDYSNSFHLKLNRCHSLLKV